MDDEGTAPVRWARLKDKLGPRLYQWPEGCTEENVIAAIPERNLLELLKNREGEMDGNRLRTLADRLALQDKTPAAIEDALQASGMTWRAVIIAAATGSKAGAPEKEANAWKKHSQQWFKSSQGGHELAKKMVALGAWSDIHSKLLPLINAVLVAAGRSALEKLDL